MNLVKKNLDNAFHYLSMIPVTGESVDYMAMARQALREAFQMLPDDDPNAEVKQNG